VILSIIGSLFRSNHHSMMGSTGDPKDGAAVAVTVFSAVVVYAVCLLPFLSSAIFFLSALQQR
jgi:ribonuclease kappa